MKSNYIYVGDNVFDTLIATSYEEQSRGLMYEPYPPPVMTFVYNYPKINKFWMKNTPSPLDIVFCCNNKIIDICKGIPFSTEIIGPDEPSDLVIEFPYGTMNKIKAKINTKIGLIKNS